MCSLNRPRCPAPSEGILRPGGRDRDEPLGEDRLSLEHRSGRSGGHARDDEGEVERAVHERGDKGPRSPLGDLNLNPGVAFAEFGEDLSDDAGAERWRCAESEAPSAKASERRHVVSCSVDVGEDPPREREESLSRMGEVDVAADAVKELDTEIGFERRNLPTQGGLGEVQAFGRAREVPGIRDFREPSELFEVHADSLHVSEQCLSCIGVMIWRSLAWDP